MTREKLEHIRNSLTRCLDHYFVKDHISYHECCDGKVNDTDGIINDTGHLYDCQLMTSIKIIDLELAKL